MNQETQLFIQYEKLLHKWAHSYRGTTGIEEEELFSEACLAYVYAINSFDANKGVQMSTWISRCVKNKLNDFIREAYRKEVTLFEEGKMDTFASPDAFYRIFSLEDIYTQLSANAKFICSLIIDKQVDLTAVPPKMARGEIQRELRELGWFWSDIWETFKELKNVL